QRFPCAYCHGGGNTGTVWPRARVAHQPAEAFAAQEAHSRADGGFQAVLAPVVLKMARDGFRSAHRGATVALAEFQRGNQYPPGPEAGGTVHHVDIAL